MNYNHIAIPFHCMPLDKSVVRVLYPGCMILKLFSLTRVLNDTPRYINGTLSQNTAIHLIFTDQSHGTYVENVEGFEHHVDKKAPPLAWNQFL